MVNETNTTQTLENVAVLHTGKDLATAVLIVSVLLNAAVFVAWLTVSVDPSISVAVITK